MPWKQVSGYSAAENPPPGARPARDTGIPPPAERGRLLVGQILFAHHEEVAATAVSITVPDAWLELPEEEFGWRMEESLDQLRRVFNDVYLRKREGNG
jgi:hypothetical protein